MDGNSEHDARLLVDGGRRLHGGVPLSGAKNSALKLLAASLLTDEPCTVRRVPRITDVATMVEMLRRARRRRGRHRRGAAGARRCGPQRLRPVRAGAHHARQHHRHGAAGGASR